MGQQNIAAIVVGLRTGRTAAEIAAFNRLPKTFFHQVNRKLDKEMAIAEKQWIVPTYKRIHGRKRDDIRKSEFVEQFRSIIHEDLGNSIRSLAQELNVDDKNVRN